MPQIWLTYEELGAYFACTADAARDGAIDAGWGRRRCSDGATRVKLPPASATEYLSRRLDAATRATLSTLLARIQEFESTNDRSAVARSLSLIDDHPERREAA